MEENLLYLIHNISHLLRFKMSKSSGQKRILVILDKEGEITQRDLTKRLGIQSSSVSEILEKMEKNNLIRRYPSKHDKRTSDVFLTKLGMELATEIEKSYLEDQKALFSNFSESELKELTDLLEKLFKNWKSIIEENQIDEDELKETTHNNMKNHKHHKDFHKHHKGFHKKHKKFK